MTTASVKLAYVSLLPPQRSGIADYSRELLPQLAQHAGITLFHSEPEHVEWQGWWPEPVQPISAFREQRWNFDLALYQMGNSRLHASIYHMFCTFPGVVVLHDLFLHHFQAERTVGAGDMPAYARELAYELGPPGLALARSIQYGQQAHPLFEIPLHRRLLQLSLGIIVHSDYAARQIEANSRIRPHLVPAPIDTTPATSQQLAGIEIPQDAMLFGIFGQLTAAKQIDRALRALKQLHRAGLDAYCLVLGAAHPAVRLPQLIDQLDLQQWVFLRDHERSLDRFRAAVQQVDAVINLRHPTVGETSAIALRAMAAAKPIIVYDVGWYAELPDSALLKVSPLSEAELVAAMTKLAADPALRQQLGAAARRHVRNHHQISMTAAAYAQAIGAILESIHAA